MLSRGDDFPIHQTPNPIAYPDSDRNFYDRYFFNAYAPDGSAMLGVAFGVYPNVNVADAHVAVQIDGRTHCLHASRVLHMERLDLRVGPIALEVLEPLQRLALRVDDSHGIAGEIVWEGRAFPIEEPRFTRRNGPRLVMDFTRLTQNCRVSGWLSVDGRRIELQGWLGTRDRSWGIRNVGMPDPQPMVPARSGHMFWQWAPLNFEDRSVFFHVMADEHGVPWNLRSAVVRDGSGAADHLECDDAHAEVTLAPGTRHPATASLSIHPQGQPALQVEMAPRLRFPMRAIGYLSSTWPHGGFKGELAVEREEISDTDPRDPSFLHTQTVVLCTLRQDGQAAQRGIGVFEQLIRGPYAPLGLTGLVDPQATGTV